MNLLLFSLSLLLLSLLLSLSSSLPLSNDNSDGNGLWTYLKDIVLGTTLTNVYHSEESFSLSVTFEQPDTSASTNTNDEHYRIGCSNYIQGSAISKLIIKDNDQSKMVPYLVNYEANAMCFVILKPDEKYLSLLDQLDFTVIRTLKLHDSIYETIGTLMEIEVRSLVQFRNAAYVTVYFGGASSPIYDAINTLYSYDLTHFESFFWSSDEATSQLVDTKDKRRATSWSGVFSKLKTKTTNDPCNFKSIQVTRNNGYNVKIPISYLWDADSELAAACLGHIASSMSRVPSVRLISLTSKQQVLNYRCRSISQSSTVGNNNDNEPFTVDNNLIGTDQIVSVADTGVDEYSCYFYDEQNGLIPRSSIANPITDTNQRKIIQYSYNPSGGDEGDEGHGHGSHTCGTIAGAINNQDIQNGDAIYDGVASGAKIAFVDCGLPGGGISTPATSAELYDPVYNAGSRTHSNSWGSLFIGSPYYSNQDDDHYLYDHTDFNIFFAAGNDGDYGDGSKTITMEATGKNIIAIGSSETTLNSANINYIAYYSSQGPAYDNRIKPELVCPGDTVESALSNGYDNGPSCQITEMSGTSMACPAAAGLAALIKEYFTRSDLWVSVCNKRYKYCQPFVASGVLTKTLLLHSGTKLDLFDGGGSKDKSLGNPPDNFQGWGRANLANILRASDINQFDLFVDDLVKINANSAITYNVQIGSSSAIPLVATISWYDAPAVDGTTQKALIQDLDLVVIFRQKKRKYFSNNLSGLDSINNNEKVIVMNPDVGTWAIIIKTKALPYGSQLFSLSITSSGSVTSINGDEYEDKYEFNDVLDDIYTDDFGQDDKK